MTQPPPVVVIIEGEADPAGTAARLPRPEGIRWVRLSGARAEGGDEAVREAGCVVVAVPPEAVVAEARRVHALDAAVQVVVAVGDAERDALERAMLFSPGLGEVWMVAPEEVDGALLERAAEVTARRRRFRKTRRRLDEGMAAVATQRTRRALISDAYLASLLLVLPDPVLSVDAAGRVLSWNPAAERLLGRAGEAAVGLPATRVVVPEDRPALERALEEAWTEPRRLDLCLVAADGSERVAEAAVTPVVAGEHRVRTLLLHDVTESRRAREELEQHAAETEAQAAQLQEQAAEMELLNAEMQERTLALEEALASRGRFYASMSHELRTPMNAIIGYNALLLDGVFGSLSAEQRTPLERAQRAAQHLLELVNDVLDLAKIEAGRIELQPEPMVFPTALHELVDTVTPVAEEQHTPVRLVGGDAEHTVVTDPRRVRQVLLNLLSNAIKFGQGHAVELAWTPLAGGGVRIEVTDEGPGIAPADQARIFEEFVQLGAAAPGGTGLGLPISRRLAELLGGALQLRSSPGEGSTFTLVLPAAPPEPPPAGRQPTGSREREGGA